MMRWGKGTSLDDFAERVDALVQRDLVRLRDALRVEIRKSSFSPRDLERQLGVGDRYIPHVLAETHRLRLDFVYGLLYWLGHDPNEFLDRVLNRPPNPKSFLRKQAEPAFASWQEHRRLLRAFRDVCSAGDTPAGPPPVTGNRLEAEIHRASAEPQRLRRHRFRYHKWPRHPGFALPLCEHLDELRYDAPREAEAAAWDVAERLCPVLRGSLEERLTVFAAALGVLGSALRQQRKFDRAALAYYMALQAAWEGGLLYWKGRTLQRASYLAVYLQEEEWARILLYEADTIFSELDDMGALARVLIDRAYVAICTRRFRRAINQARWALDLLEREGVRDSLYEPAAYQYLYLSHLELNESEQALHHLENAIAHSTQGSNLQNAILRYNQSEVLLMCGRAEEAAQGFRKAAVLFELCESWTFQTAALIKEMCALLAHGTKDIPGEITQALTALLMKLAPEEPAARASLMAVRAAKQDPPNMEMIEKAIEFCDIDRAPGGRAHDRLVSL